MHFGDKFSCLFGDEFRELPNLVNQKILGITKFGNKFSGRIGESPNKVIQ